MTIYSINNAYKAKVFKKILPYDINHMEEFFIISSKISQIML